MRIFSKVTCLAVLLSVAVLLSGCAEQNLVRGHILRESQLAMIQPGTTTAGEVLQILGTPTVVPNFAENRWLYIGQRRVRDGFVPPKMEELQIYVVDFDDNGVVQNMTYQDHNQMQLLEYNTARTVTRGSQLTVMQQLLGNLGRFETDNTGAGGVRDLLER